MALSLELMIKSAAEAMELLKLTHSVTMKGDTSYEGNLIPKANISEAKVSTSTMISVGGGQSVSTILGLTNMRGIPVRDLYPIARSAVESFINSAYLLLEDDSVAERAYKYIRFADWKMTNRNVGVGKYTWRFETHPKISPEEQFPEFVGKGNGSWTSLSVPARIDKIVELSGRGDLVGSQFLMAYSTIYFVSSEIVHGSPFAIYFFSGILNTKKVSPEDFEETTKQHMTDIMMSVVYALFGYLGVFFSSQKYSALDEKTFDLYMKMLEEWGGN